jgi:uncharacterized protein (TIGR03086 family)
MSPIADHYRRLAHNFSDTVAAVPPDRWDDPSPCEEWSARDVVNHVVDSEIGMLERVGLAPGSSPPADDPSARWSAVRTIVQESLDDPERAGREYDGMFGRTRLEDTIDKFACLDLLVHRWDLARATGLTDHEAMPADEVTSAFEVARSLGDNLRQSGACGPVVEVADDADEQSRFLAFLGRHP